MKKIIGIMAIALALALATTACDDGGGGGGDTHTHDYGTEWKSNATQHWRECTANDGAKTDVANHTGNPCSVCGYNDATHVHSYSAEWSQDATHHWRECTANDGAKTDLAVHDWEWEETVPATIFEAGEETGTCTVCGANETRAKARTTIVGVTLLAAYLSSFAPNTAGAPYTLSVQIEANEFAALKTALDNNANKYVRLELAGSNITAIPNQAFYYCATLTGITIPEGVTSIGSDAFNHCSSLANITIPESVTSISSGAFADCASLTSVTIPASVTSIGNGAFFRTGLTSVTIPNSITTIGNNMFIYCTGLTSVTIPESVTTIGSQAFQGCTSLTAITIPASVMSVGNNAFDGCTSLAGLTVDANNPFFASQDGILYNKAKTAFVAIPQGISGYITIPDGVTSIGNQAFFGCNSLISVTIPASVTSISGLFSAPNLESITVHGNNQYYANEGGDSRIVYNKAKTEIVYVVRNINGTVTLPATLTTIGSSAFYGRTGLTGITIPDSVTSIGQLAFGECTGLTEITIPASVTTISRSDSGSFYSCSNLRNIIIETDKVETYSALNWGNIFTATGLSVTFKKNPGASAFTSCTRLTSVTILEGVTSIGNSAFDGCIGLTSVTIPASVTSIGSSAFSSTSLTSVTFAGTVDSDSFSSSSPFPGDLRTKFYATDSAKGTPGTYIVTGGTYNNKVWTKQ